MKANILFLAATIVLGSVSCGGDEESGSSLCEQRCAKECQCGVQVCGSGGGANSGCVSSCNESNRTAKANCIISSSCSEIRTGKCENK